MTKMYVGNLPFTANEESVRALTEAQDRPRAGDAAGRRR
jgi:hypothetical protein